MTVLYICQFKIHTYYVARQLKAPVKLTWLFLSVSIFTCSAPGALSISTCSSIDLETFRITQLTIQYCLSISLIALSAWTFFLLKSKMTFGVLAKRKKWLYMLEGFVQLILVGRMLVITFEVSVWENDTAAIVIIVVFPLQTELIPCGIIAVNIGKRVRVYS